MSIENLRKELEIQHTKIQQCSDVDEQIKLMAERDLIMHQLSAAQFAHAEYYQAKINDIEDQSRPKTVQQRFNN